MTSPLAPHRRNGVRRSDFREVRPTPDELSDWHAQYGTRRVPPYRAEHIPCGTRIWYSGLGIGSHMRACRGPRKD